MTPFSLLGDGGETVAKSFVLFPFAGETDQKYLLQH